MRVRKVAELRPMTLADVKRVLEIERESYPDPWPRSAFTDEFDTKVPPRVAVVDGEIAGFVCRMHGPEEMHITNIAVDQRYRRQGIAAQMLAETIAGAARMSCQWIYLDVRPSNRAARALYEQFGFVELFRRKRYYIKPPEDCLVMARRIERFEADLDEWYYGQPQDGIG